MVIHILFLYTNISKEAYSSLLAKHNNSIHQSQFYHQSNLKTFTNISREHKKSEEFINIKQNSLSINQNSFLKMNTHLTNKSKSINHSERSKLLDMNKLHREIEKHPLLKLDLVDDFYAKLALKNKNLNDGHDNSIVSVEFAFLKNERLHLLVVGLKKGTICLMKKSISNVTDSVYHYDFFKKICSVQKLIKNQKNVELQKLTSLNQYLFCGLTSGVIHIVNIQEKGDEVLSSFIAHHGNITSLETFFIGDYLLTSSGSFNRNHDNSISVYHITNLSKKIYVKEKIQIKEAHGSIKGVIVCKALVHKGNELVFSAGGSDDQTLRIWNLLTGQCLFEFIYQEPIYDLNILTFSKSEQMKLSKEDVNP